MATYLTDTVLNFDKLTFKVVDIEGLGALENYEISDYTSMDFVKIKAFVSSLPESMFSWYQIQNNVTIEKIALDLYGNADYWDVLLLINSRSPLFEMPYDFDAISVSTEDKVSAYISEVYGSELPANVYSAMYTAFEEKMTSEVEEYRVIKIVKQERIQEFLQRGYEEGLFV